jgi:hypothetical protein
VKAPVAKPVPPVVAPTAPVTPVAPVVKEDSITTPTPVAPVSFVDSSSDGSYGQFIVNNWEKLASVFPTYNGTLQKKYGWQFVETMSVAEINQKMSTLPNPQFIFDQMKKKAGL